jgi:hypothetical protein
MRRSATLVVDTVFVINIGYGFAFGIPMGIRSELRGTGVLVPTDTDAVNLAFQKHEREGL